MSEHENDGVYWEPTPHDDLRQGDLLFNVPIALTPQQPRFVFGPADEAMTQTYADYPDNPPSDQIVVEVRFGVPEPGACRATDGSLRARAAVL